MRKTDKADPKNGKGVFVNQICYGERERVYRAALKVYGREMQETVAIEEMSEVVKELCKLRRGVNNKGCLAEEIADATIMLEQLRLIYDLNDEVCAFMDQKIRRLERNIREVCNETGILICGGDEDG